MSLDKNNSATAHHTDSFLRFFMTTPNGSLESGLGKSSHEPAFPLWPGVPQWQAHADLRLSSNLLTCMFFLTCLFIICTSSSPARRLRHFAPHDSKKTKSLGCSATRVSITCTPANSFSLRLWQWPARSFGLCPSSHEEASGRWRRCVSATFPKSRAGCVVSNIQRASYTCDIRMPCRKCNAQARL